MSLNDHDPHTNLDKPEDKPNNNPEYVDPLNILKDIKIKNINRLVIGQININSLRNKFEALKMLITGNLDILIITETKLDESFPSQQFDIEGFSSPFRLDRNINGGGIMIYVREDITCKEIKSQSTTTNLEGIFIEINLRNKKWLLFGGYNNTKTNITNYLSKLGRNLDTHLSKYENILLVGDFNSETKETSMNEFLDVYNLKNLIKDSTCFKNPLSPSCIDLMLTNRIRSFQNSQTIETGLSDHHKMTITVLKTFIPKKAPISIIYRDYKNYDSNLFHYKLFERLQNIEGNAICYDTFKLIFMELLNEHAKIKKKYVRANNAPFMNRQLSKAIMNRSRLKNRFHKNPSKENELKFKKQKNYCVNLLRKQKKKYYKDLKLESITDNKRFWKTMKPFFSDKNCMNKKITLIEGDKILSNDIEVAETMNDFFSNAVKSLDIQEYNGEFLPDSDMTMTENAILKFKNHPSILKIKENVLITELFDFSPAGINKIFEETIKLNKNKPTTENNIPAKILVENIGTCAPIIGKIYNDSITEGVFPSDLKDADMTPGHKKDEKTSKENYRPISILPTVSKFFERTMYTDIDIYMKKYISPFICGFRKGYSTQHCLIAMLEKMKKSLDNQHNTAALLTDLSKAFDCINHDLLIAKLEAYGFSPLSLKYIHSYLSKRRQRTKVNNSYSSWAFPETGVPQGSILGPLLFNIYLNDIFFFLDENNLANYADDNTPYKIGKCLECVLKSLEDDALILAKWFSENYLKMNADKCHLLVPRHTDEVCIKINDEVICGEPSVKLLGVKINNKLDFNEHVSNLCKKASQKLHALTRIAPYMTSDKLRILMKAFIESQFSYCPLVWMFHNRSMNNRINRIHERALRLSYSDYESSFEQLLRKDNSFTIHERNIQRLATEIYKSKNNLAPSFMKEVFCETLNPCNLRNKITLKTSNVKSVYNGTETISFRAPQIWSLVPENIKQSQSITEFKMEINKWKPEGCTCRLCKIYVKQIGFI